MKNNVNSPLTGIGRRAFIKRAAATTLLFGVGAAQSMAFDFMHNGMTCTGPAGATATCDKIYMEAGMFNPSAPGLATLSEVVKASDAMRTILFFPRRKASIL